jgi:hypothetical protein
MPMRKVDRQLYVGDDGRLIHLAGILANQPYYVPFDDVPALHRRRVWWSLAGFLVFGATILGAVEGFWSDWWCAPGFMAILATQAIVTRWVRDHYESVTNPSVKLDVRRAALANGPTLGAAASMFFATVAQTLSLLAKYRNWLVFSLVALGFTANLVQMIWIKRERDELGEEYIPPIDGVTR